MVKENIEVLERDPFVVDLNQWKMADFRAFIAAVRDESWEEVYPLIARVIVSWPFEKEASAENVAELGLLDLATTLKAVNLAVTDAFSQGK